MSSDRLSAEADLNEPLVPAAGGTGKESPESIADVIATHRDPGCPGSPPAAKQPSG